MTFSLPGHEVVERIAVGGMAEVFLARNANGDEVVVKRLFEDASQRAQVLFQRERDVLSSLDHPNVVRCFGGEGSYTIVEHVDGCDLATLIDRKRRTGVRWSLPRAKVVIEGICRGLQALHEAGYVHRDVNPSNILVGRDGNVKISDLGLASEPNTKSNIGVEGTLEYMSLEQLRGEGVNSASDIYCLGLIVFEMLTNVPFRPSRGAGLMELIESRQSVPPYASSVEPDLPDDFDAPLRSALDPNPSMRPERASEFWKALEPGLGPNGDVEGLIADVEKVCAAPVRRARAAATLSATDEAALTEPRKSGSPTAWVVGLVALSLVVGTFAVVLVPQRSADPPAGVVGAANTPTDGGVAEIAGTEPPSTSVVTTTRTTRTTRLDLPSPAVAKKQVRRRPKLPPKATLTKPELTKTKVVVVAVESLPNGALYVRGDGLQGLAPQTTPPIAEGKTILRMRAGKASLPLDVRIDRAGEAMFVSIVAPRDRYYDVDCGERAGQTPIRRIPLRGPLSCKIEDPVRGRAGFRLVPVSKMVLDSPTRDERGPRTSSGDRPL